MTKATIREKSNTSAVCQERYSQRSRGKRRLKSHPIPVEMTAVRYQSVWASERQNRGTDRNNGSDAAGNHILLEPGLCTMWLIFVCTPTHPWRCSCSDGETVCSHSGSDLNLQQFSSMYSVCLNSLRPQTLTLKPACF